MSSSSLQGERKSGTDLVDSDSDDSSSLHNNDNGPPSPNTEDKDKEVTEQDSAGSSSSPLPHRGGKSWKNLVDSDSDDSSLHNNNNNDDGPNPNTEDKDVIIEQESRGDSPLPLPQRNGKSWKQLVDSDSDDSSSLRNNNNDDGPNPNTEDKEKEVAVEQESGGDSSSPLRQRNGKSWMDLVDLDSDDSSSLHNKNNNSDDDGPNPNPEDKDREQESGGDSSDCLPTIPIEQESGGDSSDCLPTIPQVYRSNGDHGGSTKKPGPGEKPAKKKHLTQKQRDELFKETMSKTQKLIREKSVSLPYEKPKSMSLKEFLAKRAQAKAEFYNPELKKLRPPTPPPLDLTKFEAPMTSNKVEGWVSEMCDTDQLPPEEDPIGDSAVDDAFEKLDDFLMEDLTIADEETEKQGAQPTAMDIDGDGNGSKSIPLVNLEQNDKTAEESERGPSSISPICEETDAKIMTSVPATETVSVPTLMEFGPNNSDPVSVLATAEDPNPEVTAETETTPVLQTDPVVVVAEAEKATAEEDDFRRKEAALEEYLAGIKPKPPRRTIADLLKTNPAFAKIANLKPSLHPPGKGFMDFSSPKPRKNPKKELDGLETLKNRFLKHTAVKEKPKEQHFVVTVTTKEEDSQGNQKSTVDNVDYVQHFDDVDEEPCNNIISPARLTPGDKFSSFREKLQAQIRARKLKEYEEKMKQHSIYENEKTLEEKEPLEEAEEVLEDDDFTTESEPELTDEEAEAAAEARRKKKKKLKSAFVDEEAEVTGSEGDEGDESGEEEEDGEDEQDNTDGDEEGEVIKPSGASKSFRRLKLMSDSSDDEEGDEIELVTLDDDGPAETSVDPPSSEELIVPKPDPDESMDTFGEHCQRLLSQVDLLPIEMSQSQPEITPAQREISKLIQEPILPSPSQPISVAPPSMSQFDEFVSSDRWDFHESSKIRKVPFPSTLGRFDSEAALDSFKKEMPSTPSSEPLPNEIARLVGDAQSEVEGLSPNLASLCSGVFPSQNPFTPEESQCEGFDSPMPKSAALNPAITSPRNDQTTPRVEREKLNKTRLVFVELNKEEVRDKVQNAIDDEEPVGRIIKRKKRRLQFSDDEDEDEEESKSKEEVEDVEDDKVGSDVERGYDSEENEIVVSKQPPVVKGLVSKGGKIRREFVENEAELSGSEEGSGDEDERGLDQMDEEEGDEEEIDEEALRDQIGQQHMRNLMDDDARQVRRLQDVLLEDGDLHGDGNLREKQFKWKHIDKLDLDTGVVGEDGIVGQAEDEAERLWKEQKAEKARWMKENSQRVQEEEENSEEEDSQKLFLEKSKYFKLGKSTLRKIQSSCSFLDYSTVSNGGISQSESSVAEGTAESAINSSTAISRRPGIHSQAILASPDDPILKVKRGSFLSRDSSCLSRIAEMTKGAESTNSIKINSRNFVFSVITPPGPEEGKGKGKRKNLARHPTDRNEETQRRKMARVDRSFDNLDAARKAASIFSQF